MTSELKPCPFCGGCDFSIEIKEHRHLNSVGDWFYLRCKSAGCSAKADYPSRDGLITKWNTRAAPDVPELVRYRPAVYMEPCLGGMFNDEFGEYILYSQAAEIIAAKDAEIERLREALIVASMSAGFQYMTFETRALINVALNQSD